MEFKDLKIPKLDVNDEKVTIENIRYKDLEYVNEGDVLYTVSTSKSVEDYETDYSGYIVYNVEDGGEVKIGDSAGYIFKDLNDAKTKLKSIEKKTEEKPINATKKAIEHAAKIGLDIRLIKKDGIIKVSDIDEFIKNNNE